MHLNTKGLILRARDTAENDRALTILTPEFGVVSAFSNGSRRMKSNQLAAQELCYGDFSLYRRRDTYTLDNAQVISVFFGLREDITALALAQYFCELALILADGESNEILNLLLLALSCLEKKRRHQELIKPAVELRLISLAGHRPDLTRCRLCKGETLPGNSFTLDLLDGNFLCADCGSDAALSQKAGLGVLAAMRHICDCPLKKLLSFTLPTPSLKALGQICENYLRAQVPHKWNTLDFYHELRAEPQASSL